MTRNCARIIDGQYCGKPHITTRIIEALITIEAGAAQPQLEYKIDLCAEHAGEYDMEANY